MTFAAALVTLACAGRPPAPASPARSATDDLVTVHILQLNDIYEITPLAGGRWGGPARVATVLERLRAANPNTVSVLAGDLFSPSALGTAVVDGVRLDGQQMVDVMNTMGLDFATFGNHEFDLRAGPFLERLEQSRFAWISANVTDSAGRPFPGVQPLRVLTFREDDDSVRIALLGVTMDRDQPAYARIADPIAAARSAATQAAPRADVIVALTHMTLAQDIALAETVPEIDLIVGGHEHENLQLRRGETLTPIVKADANTRTVYVHELRWNTRTRTLDITSSLVPITDAIPDDPETAAVARRWVDAAFAAFRSAGFEPTEVVARVPVELNGLESVVRNRSTELTQRIADAMRAEAPDAVAAFVNSGSIRVDDVLPPGPLTQYDVIRILPFGGPILEVDMTGALLQRVLDQGLRNRGGGGFLQWSGIEHTGDAWRIAGAPLDPAQRYRITTSDFLLTGREQGLAELTRDNPELRVVATHRDIRLALIQELRRRYP